MKLVEDESELCQAATKEVQIVDNHPDFLADPDLAHPGVELWPGDFCAGLRLDEEPDLGIAFGLTKCLQLLRLGVSTLVGGGDPDVECFR